jgi:hypothetical protein
MRSSSEAASCLGSAPRQPKSLRRLALFGRRINTHRIVYERSCHGRRRARYVKTPHLILMPAFPRGIDVHLVRRSAMRLTQWGLPTGQVSRSHLSSKRPW